MSPEASRPFDRVAVVGLGVMGGSLAQALAASGRPPTGWTPDREERSRAAAAEVLLRAPDSLEETVAGADLVILATPLGAVCELTGALADLCAADAVISDVASLKAPVRDAARRAGLLSRWVGAHPMAGSEASGFGGARADLYHGARVWLVAEEEAPLERVAAFWTALDARPERIAAEEHDRLMALVSHLPQLASNVLARVLSDAGIGPGSLGPGGREATRLAASSPAIWRDILAHASPELVRVLRSLAAEAEAMAALLEAGDGEAVQERMRATRSWRTGA